MWELICHHEYKWGTIAADRSPWHSDGIPAFVEPTLGESGLRFSTPDSRVLIPRRKGDAWESMRWLHLEFIARFFEPEATLIDADRSFQVSLFRLGDGAHEINYRNLAAHDSASLYLQNFQIDVWYHFIFSLSGDTARWTRKAQPGESGDESSADRRMTEVPGVGPRGVAIGNTVRGWGSPFQGDIALFRIARFDPRSMPNDFLARPIDVGVANCWAEFFKKLKEALGTEVNCAEWLGELIPRLEQDFLQRLAQLSDAKIAEFRAMTEQYRQLWNASKVGSPEMLALMERLRDWLKAERIVALDDPGLLETFDHPCLKKLVGLLPSLDCDPDAQALLSAILGVNKPN